MLGKTLSHYKILEELGRGGMGIVYRAEDTKLERTVAIKVLPTSSLATDLDRRRLYREARAAAALHHPNIASVFEIDEAIASDSPPGSRPSPFIVMEYVEGLSMEECIQAESLSLKTIRKIMQQVASGLQAAHDKGIVHRDIKSSNIMVTSKMDAKILDFGIARRAELTRMTGDGSTFGTISYMSPEQARGESVDHRTDIWSLGVLLFEVLTGRLPFRGVYEQAIIYLILNDDAPRVTSVNSDLPPMYDFIVGKCLAKDPDDRYQSAAEIVVDLKSTSSQVRSVKASGQGAISLSSKLSGRKKWISYSGVAAISLIVGIFGTLVLRPDQRVVPVGQPAQFTEDTIHSF